MKRIFFFLIALISAFAANAQTGQPEFSTTASPKWYSVEFKTGGHYLKDPGSGRQLVTAAEAEEAAQQWQFIGTASSFKMRSKLGNYVGFSSSYFTSTTESSAVTLKFVAGATSGTWEIQRSGSTKCMNQWGGTGVGAKLGEWNVNDPNNPMYFNEVESAYLEPVFSTDGNETYFMIQFAKNGNDMASLGTGNQARVAAPSTASTHLWKFVGNASNFQIVCKDGNYINVKSNQTAANGQTGDLLVMSATPDASGFSIVPTTNSTYAGAYEIKTNGSFSHKYFNQWGGADAGNSIGLWDAGDPNNPLFLVDASQVTIVDPYPVEGIASLTPEHQLTLWYKQPASSMNVSDQWMEYSLPIGNGQFGACLFGGIAKDEIQFNEKTLWSGKNTDNGTEYGDYENFGSVFVEDLSGAFGADKAVKDYYRYLDLENATAGVKFKSTDKTVNYSREYIASNPNGVVAMRYKADQPGKMSLRVTLAAGKPGIRATAAYDGAYATFSGALETVSYNARVKVVPTGGTMSTTSKGIVVENADEVLIILGGATDFDAYAASYVSNTAGLDSKVKGTVDAAAGKSWSELYTRHVTDYKSYFDRCSFQLEGAENIYPTDVLIDTYRNRSTGRENYALFIEQLYFAYGRYLEISSSRGVDLPSNLQGIWNNSSEPAWNADIHSNINVQMNYWPAETTNLSEMHVPFLNYIINMATNHNEWKTYAQAAGQSEGWTCYTENNIFGGVGSFMHNYVIANAWYCTHLWQHYRYTLDRDFLKKAFPAMWSASRFWVLRLKKASDGTYECPNEYSPEHGPGSENGVAHAQQLVWELFDNTLQAAAILGSDAGVSSSDLATLQDRFDNLDKGLATETYNGGWGTTAIANGSKLLREWKYSAYSAGQNGHRHMSHLMCLYPYGQVTPESEYFTPAINSMKLRGDASTGWSMGWKINLWARALDGDHAHDILELALTHYKSSSTGGGVYYNLFDSHSPFQIDGNFGACAGIGEMIMQSVSGKVRILPALPNVWRTGKMTGMKAVGDFTVDVAWADGIGTYAEITSNQGQPLTINYPYINGKKIYLNGKLTSNFTVVSANEISMSTSAGDKVFISLDGVSAPTPTGIASVFTSDGALNVSLNGRALSVTGKDVKSIRVYDAAGRTIQKTRRSTLNLNGIAAGTVLVEVTAADGTVTTQKHILK